MPLRFPWLTHLVAGLAFPVWFAVGTAATYGIDVSGQSVWWGFGELVSPLVLLTVLVLGVPLAFLEAWVASASSSRWPARLVVMCFVLGAGYVSHLPAGLRFFGDQSPTDLDDLTLSWTLYVPMVLAQMLVARALCLLPFRRVAAAGRVRWHDIAVRLGLVER